jgi:hypothetical protein
MVHVNRLHAGIALGAVGYLSACSAVLGIEAPIPTLSGGAHDALPLPDAEASAPDDANGDAFLLPEVEGDAPISADADPSDSGGSLSDGESETGPDGSAPADGPFDGESGVGADAARAPTGLAIGAPMPIPQAVGSGADTSYRDTCPAGQVIIGYAGQLVNNSNNYQAQIQALCGTINLTGGGPWNVTTAPGASLPIEGTDPGPPWTEACPANQMVVGFVATFDQRIHQIFLSCAPLAVSSDGTISVGTITVIGPTGSGGSMRVQSSCPTGSVATVSKGNAGRWINAFGIECSSISVTY